jgi:predicted nuclease of predicted toxin-antitoxin system
MAEPIRFHLDESQSFEPIAEALRRHGIDVSTTQHVGLRGASDAQQLEFARAHQRVLFTQDDDYLALHGAGSEHVGIVYAHQQEHSVGEIIEFLVLVWSVYKPEEMHNRVEYV